MKQKDYKIEIVLELLKESSHIREIAKKLKTNPMTISRKINELTKENVMDYREEGKNKKFFLKKTIEAQNYAIIAEIYKLNNLLEKYPHLREIIEKIQKDNRIKFAILFGSYAKGIPKEESDIDIYIETSNIQLKKDLGLLNTRLSIKIGKYNKDNLLIKEIEKNHVIIKGVETYYEKNKILD